jgi:hypothetical protein
MVGLVEEVSSNMVSEPMSWVQFPLTTQFFTARIPPSLASAGTADTAAPKREQTAPTTLARTQEGECWTIAYETHPPLPYHLCFMVGLIEEVSSSTSYLQYCSIQSKQGEPWSAVMLLSCDHKVMGSSPRNRLLREYRERLHT